MTDEGAVWRRWWRARERRDQAGTQRTQRATEAMHRGAHDDRRLRSTGHKSSCSRKRRQAYTPGLAAPPGRPRILASLHSRTSGPGSTRRRNRRAGRTCRTVRSDAFAAVCRPRAYSVNLAPRARTTNAGRGRPGRGCAHHNTTSTTRRTRHNTRQARDSWARTYESLLATTIAGGPLVNTARIHDPGCAPALIFLRPCSTTSTCPRDGAATVPQCYAPSPLVLSDVASKIK